VVVDVGLAEVLLLLVLVGLVVVRYAGMVVLVAVGRDQVGDVLAMTAVMRHVPVLVIVNCGIVGMHVHSSAPLPLRSALTEACLFESTPEWAG
jgi:hypothetical protein